MQIQQPWTVTSVISQSYYYDQLSFILILIFLSSVYHFALECHLGQTVNVYVRFIYTVMRRDRYNTKENRIRPSTSYNYTKEH